MSLAPLPLLIPGNMCDARLWDEGLRERLAAATVRAAQNADTTQDDSIAAVAARAGGDVRSPPRHRLLDGAIVAVEMAVMAPDRIAGLVLIGHLVAANRTDTALQRLLHDMGMFPSFLERQAKGGGTPPSGARNASAPSRSSRSPCRPILPTWPPRWPRTGRSAAS